MSAMQHIDNIVQLLETLSQSEVFHALIVQSPPGWAKSTTIDQALARLGTEYFAVGSYTTPLNLYNVLCEHPSSLIVLDDCIGLFNDAKAMSILKSATWPSAGVGSERRISWGSTSEKVLEPSTVFTGKLILLSNTIPAGKETEAFLSRTLPYRIAFTIDQVREMLLEAALSEKHFGDPKLAAEVAHFLVDQIDPQDPAKISLRTLQMGYELARTQAANWRELLPRLLPTASSSSVAEMLASQFTPVKDQAKRFLGETGLSRRTFYNYRKRMGLSRTYRRGKPGQPDDQ